MGGVRFPRDALRTFFRTNWTQPAADAEHSACGFFVAQTVAEVIRPPEHIRPASQSPATEHHGVHHEYHGNDQAQRRPGASRKDSRRSSRRSAFTAAKPVRSRATRSPIRSSARRRTRSPIRKSVIDFIEEAAAARRIRPLRQPGRARGRAKAGRARRRRGGRAVFQRHGGDRRPVDGQAQLGRRSDLLRRVLSPQPRVLLEAFVAVRREDACR